MDALNIGIDVSKDRLDVAANSSSMAPFHVPRDHGGLADLVERLTPLGAERIALEATGGFETVVAAALAAAGLPVVIVNPAQVRAFAQAMGKRAKTDQIDAAVIARFAEATRPDLRPLPDAETEALSDLVARRRQIIAMIGAENQRLKRASSRMAKSIKRLLKALEKELADIDQDIDGSIRRSPNWLDKVELMKSVPGIGDQIARTLIAELPELGTLDRRQIAPSSAWLPGRANPANGKVAASSAVAEPACAQPSTWEPSSQLATTPVLKPSAIASSLRENQSSSPSSPSPESSSPSSMLSSGIINHGANKTLD